MEQFILKAAESGIGGLITGLVLYFVVSPLLGTLRKSLEGSQAEIAAQRQERETMCARHQTLNEKNIEILSGLKASIDVMVRRANGG
jgi:F0F1-type ATP synthase membrane subunit b/b'